MREKLICPLTRGGRQISSSAFLSGRPFGYYLPIASYCNGNCPCQNFRSKNSFKSDVALKHAPDERPVKKAYQKSEIAPRERRREEKT